MNGGVDATRVLDILRFVLFRILLLVLLGAK